MNPFEIHISRDLVDPTIIEGIIDIFDKQEIEEVVHTDKGIYSTVIGESNSILKYNDGDREILLCQSTDDSGVFLKVVDWVKEFIHPTEDFDKVDEWRIISYPQGSTQNWSKEDDDSLFTGIAIIELCNDYKGGNLIVDNNTIVMEEGDVIQFNNPSQRHYGMPPVMDGERVVLELWYSPFEDEPEEEIQESSGKVYQKVQIKS